MNALVCTVLATVFQVREIDLGEWETLLHVSTNNP